MKETGELTVLVCSANVGNAEPTPESFAEWVPLDGDIAGPLSATKYPVDGVADSTPSLAGEKFDVIVLGMQEAAFVEKKKKDGKLKQMDSDTINTADAPESCQQERPNSDKVEKEAKKPGSKLWRKALKANLVVRGLTGGTKVLRGAEPHRRDPKLRTEASHSSRTNISANSLNYDTRKFHELITARCPSYDIVVSKLRGEMRLYLLVSKELAEEVQDVFVAGENTGIGGVLANKGGIIATFTLRGTRLSFMTSHLEAHEGENHYMNRNSNLAEIFNGAKPDPRFFLDATVISHHMFVCGDLNYRTRLGDRTLKKKSKSRKVLTLKASDPDDGPDTNGSHFEQAKALVEAEDWKTLNDGDELKMALKDKHCMCEFNTLPCYFPPTFKVARCEGYQYNEKRTPSYTDRILWKSNDGMTENVRPFLYEPCPDFITSDHKPIRGGFTVKLNKSLKSPKTKSSSSTRELNLLISDIKCKNLPVMDAEVMGGKADPYILFMSDPKPILYDGAWPSSKVIRRDLNPVWKHATHLKLDSTASRNSDGKVDLAGTMLHITVMDEDLSSGDDVIGTVSLSLADLFVLKRKDDPQKTTICKPLFRNGLEQGTLECTILSAYLKPKEEKAFLKLTSRKVKTMRSRGGTVMDKMFGWAM
mmetsp:Transcript_27144/g.64439  ORF Transcript_27144/g.64439 Transcript_27144/m.64439 type:complete len:647 (+) Transcript_27144:143-2083(+)